MIEMQMYLLHDLIIGFLLSCDDYIFVGTEAAVRNAHLGTHACNIKLRGLVYLRQPEG